MKVNEMDVHLSHMRVGKSHGYEWVGRYSLFMVGIILNNNLYFGLVSNCGGRETLFCLGLTTVAGNIHVCHPVKVVCQRN